MTVRLLLVDDHPVVRAGLKAVLSASDDVDVVGEAAGAAEAIELVRTTPVDVVLMDLRLGDGVDGVQATFRLRQLDDPPRVLILTTYESDNDILQAVQAGAAGYLLKDASPDDLVRSIRSAAAGETVLAPMVASRLLGRMQAPEVALSPRELEILERVAQGESNRQIAQASSISEATVKSHLVHIYDKLGADSRTRAVQLARERGLL